MPLKFRAPILAAAFLIGASGACFSFESSAVVAARQPKCSAPTVEDYEGTDMSGITPKCEATFNACIDEAAPCSLRKQKCKEFDKMEKDSRCYRKRRS